MAQSTFGEYRPSRQQWMAIAAFVAFSVTLARYLIATVGANDLFVDAEVWQQVGKSVLDGVPLYTDDASDNKPPLWQFIIIAASATGAFVHVMYLITAISNVLISVLTFLWVEKRASTTVAGTAAVLVASTLPHVSGTIINVRSPAVALLLVSLLLGPIGAGLAIGAAGLISQQVGLAAVVVVYKVANSADNTVRAVVKFGLSVGLSAIVVYGVVGVIWSPDVLEQAIKSSILESSEYVNRPNSDGITKPLRWASGTSQIISALFYILIPAVAAIISDLLNPERQIGMVVYLLAGLFSLTLLYQSLPYYWLPIMPFVSYFAAAAVVSLTE